MDNNHIQHYNAFGGLVVKNNHLTVTMTAVQNERSIHRTLTKDVDLPDIKAGETCVAQFGIFIDSTTDKHKVVMYEMLKPKSKKPLLDMPQIEKSIAELADVLKKAMQ